MFFARVWKGCCLGAAVPAAVFFATVGVRVLLLLLVLLLLAKYRLLVLPLLHLYYYLYDLYHL